MLICIINNRDVAVQMYLSKFKMVHNAVEEHDPENKPDTVHCVNKSYLLETTEFLRIVLFIMLFVLNCMWLPMTLSVLISIQFVLLNNSFKAVHTITLQ